MKIYKNIIINLLYFFLILNNGTASENLDKVDKISKNLRCLICQGQSVYDSQSDFALSIKQLIKIKISEGNEDKEIYEYLKSKYGDWIMYEPELDNKTILLWILPLILFIFGGLLIYKKAFIRYE
tara:strand:- start:458 stop:832 length:375 start_codon:yes stop_codon:yes gene_type:complete